MMVTFGQKLVAIAGAIIFLWMCIGIFMYRRYLHLTDEDVNFPLSKSPEKEIFHCKSKGQKLSPGFWKRINLHRISIPDTVKMSASEINVGSHSVTVQDTKVHYLYARPTETSRASVLLLHGQAFTSETWNKIDTIRILASFGYHSIAVDLPGYGKSPAISNLKKSKYLDDLITALNIKNPVVVSPSMSGAFSIKHLIEHPEKFGGFIPVSPVSTSLLTSSSCAKQGNDDGDIYLNEDCQKVMPYLKSNELKLNCIKVPTLVVWGEMDRHENSAKLCLLPESQGAEIPEGKHPAYLSNPDLWHKLLYNFLTVLNETQVCTENIL